MTVTALDGGSPVGSRLLPRCGRSRHQEDRVGVDVGFHEVESRAQV